MMRGYFKNPEIKRMTLEFSFVFIIFMILSCVVLKVQIDQVNENYIEQNTLIVGNILSTHPEMEKEVLDSIVLKDKSNYDLGKKILNQYSYDKQLKIYKNPLMVNCYKYFLLKVLLILIFFSLTIYILVINKFIGFYKKAKFFTKASEEIVEGNFEKFKDENKEGDFYILSLQFKLMANRFYESLQNLKREKLFLKNIISDISHQLKTPLSSLIMFNELMKNENMPKEDRDNFLDLSDQQLKRMEWLIINLLKIGRLEAGVIEFNMIKNPLYITVNKSLAGLIQKAKEKSQEIIVDIDKNVYFKHDMDWTGEAVSNIIKNSIEHTKDNGKIVISCEETPISISIFIKDNGDGIPKKIQKKIFKRFYKGENSINPCSIGIGLSLSKSIIESQNGSISVESEEGRGTEFAIIFLKTII